MKTFFKIWTLAVLAAAIALLPNQLFSAERGPMVLAAASLKTALDAVAADYEAETGQEPVLSYAATPALAKQIEQGAHADIFISADEDWMDYVESGGLVDPASRFGLLGNRLVLIAPIDSEITVSIERGFPLADHIGEGRLAVAGIDAVPAGKYAKAALQNLKVWNEVKDKLAQAENVRAALRLVSRGEAPLGIVYTSDAIAEPGVKVLGTFPQSSHPPIVYLVARIEAASTAQSDAFLAYLKTPAAAAHYTQNGFAVAVSEPQ